VVAGESPLRGRAHGHGVCLSDQGAMCSGCHVAAASVLVIPQAAAAELGTSTSTNQMIRSVGGACLPACVRVLLALFNHRSTACVPANDGEVAKYLLTEYFRLMIGRALMESIF